MSDDRATESKNSEEATKPPDAGKPAELSDDALDKVAGGSIPNMKHEQLKGIAQNLRG